MKKTNNTYRFLISGGGTGGHIYPALAIADELRQRLPDAEFLFVGAQGKMEMEKVPKAGYKIIGLPITGIQRSFSWKNLLFPFRLMQSLFKANQIVNKFQPDIAIGTGGFASGPTLLVAQRKGVKTVLQEQNSLPGITNKRLGGKAKRIFVAYDQMESYFPDHAIINAGNPIRAELFTDLPSQKEAKEYFNLNPNLPVILSVGGSLGSRTLNNVWKNDFLRIPEAHAQLIWQTGSLEYQSVPDKIKETEGIEVREFIHKMNMAYAAADIIISRAGAIAISELAIVGKPVILVPYPHAAENHQMKNAKALENKNAAIVVEDSLAENTLANIAINLLKNSNKRNGLTQNIKMFAKPTSTNTIVDEILKLIES